MHVLPTVKPRGINSRCKAEEGGREGVECMGPGVMVRQVLANRRVPRSDQTITCGSVHCDSDVQKFPQKASKRGFYLSIGRCGVMSLRNSKLLSQ